jgi:hippurate hydrolase
MRKIEMENWHQHCIPGLLDSFEEMKRIRQDLHQHPELGYQEERTSQIVANCLENWGYQVTRNLGGTGVVGTLKVGHGDKSIGLRADMDALPITEAGGCPYASSHAGIMHACGHDGHTATLLAAARHLAQTRDFSGTLNLIFQPSEESDAGARAMLNDGLLEIAPCDMLYAWHNYPSPTLKFGQMSIGIGAVMASVDSLLIRIKGKGGHAASPHFTCDPIVAAGAIIQALQTIISRNANPFDCAAVSITSIHAGTNFNVIPGELEMKLSVRTFDQPQRTLIMQRIHDIVQAQATCFGVSAKITEAAVSYPAQVNAEAPTMLARRVAAQRFGAHNVIADHPPILAADDFAFMAQRVPACYINIGAGEGAALHNRHYDFNDALIPLAGSLLVYLTQAQLR